MLRFLPLPVLVSLILLTAQCTVQKRLYGKGYSVSWNKKFSHSGKLNEQNEQNDEELADESKETEKALAAVDTAVSIADETSVLTDGAMSDPGENSVLEENEKAPLADTVYVIARHVPEGVAAVSALGGSLILARVAGYAGLSTGLVLLGAAVLFFASFALAIVSLIVFSRYRKDYVTNVFGKVTFIFDVVIIGLAILFFILALLL